ncbi:MAG: glycerol-3-phosphate acyltransferase [Candidatus Heimdallarchaeota archaeon]
MGLLNILWLVLAFLGAFVLGSFPFSVWVGKLATGKDLREGNIGNPGAFNAMITFSPIIGISITLLDLGKGALTIALVDHIFALDYFSTGGLNYWYILACVLSPVFCALGHNYSPWLKFKGGRGTGVLMGTLLYMNPLVYLAYMLMIAFLTQLLKVTSRFSGVVASLVTIPIAFFLPITAPWTFILSSWVAGATGFAFIIQGLIVVALWFAILPKHWPGVVQAFTGKGKDWSFSVKDGQDIDDIDVSNNDDVISSKDK